jgi:DASS family divalent anion:Na+ symporter
MTSATVTRPSEPTKSDERTKPAEPARPAGKIWLVRAIVVAVGAAIWFCPVPEGLTPQAWHLFAIFAATIGSVIVGAFPILTASVLAVGIAVLSRVLPPAKAYAGFANGTILLIVVAFLVARAIVKSGLGARLGHLVVRLFGRSTLGLGYSIFFFDAVIAPAFPSDTARSGVLYPLAFSLAEGGGSKPDEATRRKMGAYLMFCAMATLSLSSALWLTAMAGNPLGVEIGRAEGFQISFVSWLVASAAPTLVCLAILPLLIYKVFPPEVKSTPEAPAAARKALAAMGRLSAQEKIVAATFVVRVVLWGLAGTLKIDLTAVAFLGLGTLLATGVLTLDDIKQQGDVLGTFIWFAILYTLSGQLNALGFMGYLGQRLGLALGGVPRPAAYVILVLAYVVLHYLFVSQTAHVLALFGVFLGVGAQLGVSVPVLGCALLFSTSYLSTMTPQASSANVLVVGSGYLTQKELYRLGSITTAFNVLVLLLVGTPWLLFVAR